MEHLDIQWISSIESVVSMTKQRRKNYDWVLAAKSYSIVRIHAQRYALMSIVCAHCDLMFVCICKCII